MGRTSLGNSFTCIVVAWQRSVLTWTGDRLGAKFGIASLSSFDKSSCSGVASSPSPLEITQGMVEDFKTAGIREKRWGKQKGCAVSVVTVNRALSTLRLIYNYAERCGFQVSNPVKHVEFFRETGRERIISLQEEVAYLAAASQPLKDIARIILDTGMRPEEVFRIERTNVDLAQRTIMNPIGKTKAARRKLTMTEEVWAIMKKRSTTRSSLYVFPSPDNPERPIGSVRKAHDGAVRRANVKPAFRLYDLRHTYASRAVMAGVDLPTLGALLVHTRIQMTMRYVHPFTQRRNTRRRRLGSSRTSKR